MTAAGDAAGRPITAGTAPGGPRLAAIWAQDRHGVIGIDGGMPWHLPAEFAHFRDTTRGATVVMGRATWESFEDRYRPLPGRRNVVVTRDTDYDAPGAEVTDDLDAAVATPSATGTTWVIGGGTVYAATMPRLDELVVTVVDFDAPAPDGSADPSDSTAAPREHDVTHAPRIDPTVWDAETGEWRGGTPDEPGPRWRVHRYRRRGAAQA